MDGITSIGHVAIKVKDVDASLAFWRDLIGFPEMLRLHHKDDRLWLVYLRITDHQYLEIFPDAEEDRAPGWNANGVNHVCLTVVNIEDVVRRMEQRGIKMLNPVKEGADGNKQAWIEDPDGNRMELMEMMPGSLQLKAIERLREMA